MSPFLLKVGVVELREQRVVCCFEMGQEPQNIIAWESYLADEAEEVLAVVYLQGVAVQPGSAFMGYIS